MNEFKKVSNPKSWVWEYFLKSDTRALCMLCEDDPRGNNILQSDRNTSTLIGHLKSKHGISKPPKLQAGTLLRDLPEGIDGNWEIPEEEPFAGPSEAPPQKRMKQSKLNSYLVCGHTLRNDVLRLICESGITMNQIVTSQTFRRILNRAYPSDAPTPKCGATIRKYLSEEAEGVRQELRIKFEAIRSKGLKLSISFDEATLIGLDRYLTLNVHHCSPILGESKVAPLGLVRVNERATGEYLHEVVCRRLQTVGLSSSDILAAATDGASNVLKAVDLMGVRKQQCMAHGLDLVVRKTIYGKETSVFDSTILDDSVTDEEDTDEETESEHETSQENERPSSEQSEEGDYPAEINLGAALQRLREVARNFRKRPFWMDEIRKITRKEEYNGKELRVRLDVRTRWYSTLLMIERALEIMPAMNNVLSRYDSPLTARGTLALANIAGVLAPFKRAILLLCKSEATLSHADRVFHLLLEDLESTGTELAENLLGKLKEEIKKRRTILSSALAVLENPQYDFSLELTVGIRKPSKEELLRVFADIVDADEFPASLDDDCGIEPTVRVSWDSVYSTPTTSACPNESRETCTKENLRRELALFKGGGGRGRLLSKCKAVLSAIPPTSVQPERDFSTVRLLLGENRARMEPSTLDNIFVLRKSFQYKAK